MNLREIGSLVRARREHLGLSQQRLGRLSGLSRATINQLETGSLNDLGAAKLAALMGLIGLRLQAGSISPAMRGLIMASRTASVGYGKPLDPADLTQALLTGELSPTFVPHVATLLDEAPLSLVVAAVEEAAQGGGVPPQRIWRHVLRWATDMRSPRKAWA